MTATTGYQPMAWPVDMAGGDFLASGLAGGKRQIALANSLLHGSTDCLAKLIRFCLPVAALVAGCGSAMFGNLLLCLFKLFVKYLCLFRGDLLFPGVLFRNRLHLVQ